MSRCQKTAKAHVSESFLRRLNSYAVAAGAAGMAIVATMPAEARIINEQINFPLFGNQEYDFNPAEESLAPFIFQGSFINRTNAWWNRAFFQPNSAGASAVVSAGGLPVELASGAQIGPSQNWGKGASYGLLFTYGPYGGGTREHHKGNFGAPGFVGFRFAISGKQYYGWVRLKFSVHAGPNGTEQTTTQIVNCAFETTPNTPIRAGQTRDLGDSATSYSIPRGVASHDESTVKRGTLAALAVGALGVREQH